MEHFRTWVADACQEWGYPDPNDAFYASVVDRLGEATLSSIGLGLEKAIVKPEGLRFNVARNQPHKGPYKWFSHRTGAKSPQVNWEYYIQVAYLVRIWEPCIRQELRPVFEDELMDLAVRRGKELIWCIEVKEKASQLKGLLSKLESLATDVDMRAADRGNDALRKAKYLVKQRPLFFSGIANGLEKHFRASFPGPTAFTLTEALPPVDVPSATLDGLQP